MTPSELKYEYQRHNINGTFFDRDSMKFFGDTMSNYGCRSEVIDGVECWALWRKRPVKYGKQSTAYFAKTDFRIIIKQKT